MNTDYKELIEGIRWVCDDFSLTKEHVIRFIMKFLTNYEAVYQLKKIEGNDPISLEKIWEATDGQFLSSDCDEDLEELFVPSQMPCPIQNPQQFKNYILEKLNQYTRNKKNEIEELKKEFEEAIGKCSFIERPIYASASPEHIFITLREESSSRICLSEIPVKYETEEWETSMGESQTIWVPQMEKWQTGDGVHNFTIESGSYDALESLVATLLLSFPIGKLKITIVDMELSHELAMLKNGLNDAFISQYILNDTDFVNWLKTKTVQLQKTFSDVGDIVDFNLQRKEITQPYELCIINGLPLSLRHDSESSLMQLIRQGYRAGIYFVVCKSSNTDNLLDVDNYISLEYNENPSPLFDKEQRRKLISLLNNEVGNEKKRQQDVAIARQQQNKQQQYSQEFEDATQDLSVVLGYDGKDQEYIFTLDSPHALILGKTGSGKSNFLHLLLTGSMLKYSPDTLHFYLMDMKPGGVELADYRDMPHVSTLVADPGDAPINVEFLRSVKEQIEIRARRMQKAGVRDLQGYNMRNPDKKLPRIVMLIDEFQSLFDRKKYTDLSMMMEVESLLSDILAKGRSYGIHAILSTQTLMGTQIPESVAKIEKQYFLKSDTFDMGDIRMFVRDVPEKELEEMRSHEAFSVDNAKHVFQYFMPDLLLDEESHSLQDRLFAVLEKCEKYQVKSAKSVYYSVTQLECPELAEGLAEMYSYYSDYPEVSLGRSIEISSLNVSVRLENAKGQNLLITGVNERGRFCTEEGGKWQGLRILLTSLISLLHYSKSQHIDARFIFLLNNIDLKPGTKGYSYIQELKEVGDIELYRGAEEQLNVVEGLLEQVKNGREGQMTFVFVEGQDYYRLDRELRVSNDSSKEEEARLFSFGSKPFGGAGGQKQTVRDAWLKILEDGPLYGIHTIWQVQNFERFLTDAPSSRRYFQNMVFLYNNTLRPVSFKMTEDIDFKRLDATSERLRMCLFDGIDVNVIAPYQIPYEDEIEEVINQQTI